MEVNRDDNSTAKPDSLQHNVSDNLKTDNE